jgi:Porin PorA
MPAPGVGPIESATAHPAAGEAAVVGASRPRGGARARSSLVVAGLCLLAAAAAWHFWLAPRWTQRIPPGWSWKAEFIGVLTYADPGTGAWPVKDVTSVYHRSMSVIAEAERPRRVVLQDAFVVRDPTSGKKTWEYVYAAPVDPGSGRHLSPEYSGDVFVFPRNVAKTTYSLRFNYLKGIPVAFEREEEVAELATYVFSYRGRAEYTESYAGTADFEGIRVEPGQDIRCADDQFALRVWVEPVTGELVKLEEGCDSGDSVYETATGRPIRPIARWGGVTAGDDVALRAEAIRRARNRYLWTAIYVPVAVAVGGGLLLAAGVAAGRSRRLPDGEAA